MATAEFSKFAGILSAALSLTKGALNQKPSQNEEEVGAFVHKCNLHSPAGKAESRPVEVHSPKRSCHRRVNGKSQMVSCT